MSLEICGIKIEYDNSFTSDINRIFKIIENNQILFSDYKNKTIVLGTEKEFNGETSILVNNFDGFFGDLLKQLLENKEILNALNNPDLLPALYLQLLIKNDSENEKNSVSKDNIFNVDILYFLSACKYYNFNEQYEEMLTFLKYRNDSDKILNWLKESERFNTYNYVLKIIFDYLREYELDLFNNFNDILSKITKYTMDSAIFLGNNKISYKLPLESSSNIDIMFINFLKSIKAPKEWIDIYKRLKEENKITYEINNDGKDYSKYYIDEDGERKIKISTDGSIKSFISLAHEFAHYISYKKGDPLVSSSEFPAIFYERLAATYLEKIGYGENIVKYVMVDRKNNNFDIYSCLISLLEDICKYSKTGIVRREEKIAYEKEKNNCITKCQRELLKILETENIKIEELELLKTNDNDIEKAVDEECDYKILTFAKKGLEVINGYQYLIGSYIVDKLMENIDEEVLSNMEYITNNLSQFNINGILKTLNIEGIFSSEETEIKKKKYTNE